MFEAFIGSTLGKIIIGSFLLPGPHPITVGVAKGIQMLHKKSNDRKRRARRR